MCCEENEARQAEKNFILNHFHRKSFGFTKSYLKWLSNSPVNVTLNRLVQVSGFTHRVYYDTPTLPSSEIKWQFALENVRRADFAGILLRLAPTNLPPPPPSTHPTPLGLWGCYFVSCFTCLYPFLNGVGPVKTNWLLKPLLFSK